MLDQGRAFVLVALIESIEDDSDGQKLRDLNEDIDAVGSAQWSFFITAGPRGL